MNQIYNLFGYIVYLHIGHCVLELNHFEIQSP
jgi:hypothetical protein